MSVKTELAEEVLACRLCLATDTKLYGIYEYHFDRIVTEITGLKLATWDGLPRYVCACCRSELLGTAEFRNRCVRADQLLQYLMHQHSITMDSIKTIDRVSNKLALNLSIHKIDQSPIEFTHDDSDKNDIFITENSTEKTDVDNKINDKNDHFDDEIDNDVYDEDDEPLAVVFNDISTIDDELVKDSNKDAIEAVEDVVEEKKPSKVLRKRKKVPISKVKVKQKVEEGKKERSKEKSQFKRKKKGFKRFFSCEEDYIKFENNYNISIVKVSEEEQRKDMEARKESANYARAHIRCDKCYKGFLSEATFENHQKVHDPSMGSNSCHLCSARFKHPTRLRRHMETHALKFICKLCPLVTRHRGMAMMHSDFHSGKTFECKYCGVTFKKKTTFNTHIRVQHPLENASGGTCDVCGETFIGKRGLQQHKTMAHRKLPIPELKCASCGVQFENLDAVVRHSGDDSVCDPKLRSCPQCGETFPKDSQLEAHLLNSHVQQFYKCDDCDKSFATKSSLGTHVDRVHLRIKPKKSGVYKYHMYQKKMQTKRVEEICEICGKGYPSSTWLKYHQRTHTGERPYKCPECPKSYMTPAALQSHSVSHTGVRRWQCSQCPKTFLHQSSIYKHKLVHTGEKPYECHICNKTFTQSGSLATHVKYVHMKLKPPPRRRRRDAAV